MISKTEEHGRNRDNTVEYSYDYENRLIRAAYPGRMVTEYVYDGDGKRVRKIENGKVTKYLYDGMNVIIERDSRDKTLVSYTRGLSYGGGIGGIISKTIYHHSRFTNRKPLATYYYHYDGNGNVTLLTDSSGIPAQKYSYDSWGNLTSESGYVENNYRFQTKEYDERSGLYYFGARYYNPEFRRWTQKDPLKMIDGPNMYLYCLNNPVNFYDPFGFCKKPQWFRPPNEGYAVGTNPKSLGGKIVPTGGVISRLIEDHTPSGHRFGEIHDQLLDHLQPYLPFPAAAIYSPVNIPTWIICYPASWGDNIINSIF